MSSYTTLLHTLNAKLIAARKSKYYINRYKELSTDEERIILSLNVMLEYNILPQICGDTKNAEKSEILREQGNKVFISKPLKNVTCIEALKLYTESIAYAPPSSVQLALAYANRSAVLIKLHKYEETIKDIERALALKCADNIRAKLYVRQVECLSVQKHCEVETIIKETQSLLENLSLNDTYRKSLNDKLMSIKPSHNLKTQNIHEQGIFAIKNCNTKVPCASDAIAIEYNEEFGRHIVSTRSISPGEIIVKETSYCKLLTPSNVYTHCSYCLEVCWANIPCDYCVHAMYCSDECKVSDWKMYHDIECKVFPALLKMDFSKLDLFSLRIAVHIVREAANMQKLRADLKEVDNCGDPIEKGFFKDGVYIGDTYNSLFALATNVEKRSVQDLFRRSIDSCVILYFVATCTNMFGSPLKTLSDIVENADVTFFGGLILRNQMMIPSNCHSCDEERDLQAQERYIAVLPFLSLFNHSCNPNVCRCTKSGYTACFATHPIKKGEQIFDNYGQLYALTPQTWRQKELLKQYYFECNCIACTEGWPTSFGLKSLTSLTNVANQSKIWQALHTYNKYVHMARAGTMTDVKTLNNALVQILEVMNRLVPMPCQEFLQVVETFKLVYALSGNRFIAPEL